jgi:transcriptional regulator with XRE-family HTH domain
VKGGKLIREARRRAGLTQVELARRVDVSQPVVARWEAGAGSMTMANLVRVLRGCGFGLDLRLAPLDEGADHDWSLVEANLARTPDQRLAHAEAAANLVLSGRAAMAKARRARR